MTAALLELCAPLGAIALGLVLGYFWPEIAGAIAWLRDLWA